MTQHVRIDGLGETDLAGCFLERVLGNGVVEMVATFNAGARITAKVRGWEHPLPPPFCIGDGILAV